MFRRGDVAARRRAPAPASRAHALHRLQTTSGSIDVQAGGGLGAWTTQPGGSGASRARGPRGCCTQRGPEGGMRAAGGDALLSRRDSGVAVCAADGLPVGMLLATAWLADR